MSRFQQFSSTLRQGHQALKECIVAVQTVVRSYPEARPALHALETVLITHWERQTQQVFTDLSRFFQESRQDIKMLEFLLHDLKDMKIKTLVFYDQYSGALPIQEAHSLRKNFHRFTEDILNRIRIEEEYFLPLLAKADAQV